MCEPPHAYRRPLHAYGLELQEFLLETSTAYRKPILISGIKFRFYAIKVFHCQAQKCVKCGAHDICGHKSYGEFLRIAWLIIKERLTNRGTERSKVLIHAEMQLQSACVSTAKS